MTRAQLIQRNEQMIQMLKNLRKDQDDYLLEHYHVSHDELKKMIEHNDDAIDDLIEHLMEDAPENEYVQEILDEICDCFG